MPTAYNMPVIAHAIQLAVAPVFLLTGIAAMLGVMAARLARVIDRARLIEHTWNEMDERSRSAARAEIRRPRATAQARELVDQLLRLRGAPHLHRHRHAFRRGILFDQPALACGRALRGCDVRADRRADVVPARGLSRNAHAAHRLARFDRIGERH
jgi:hypothetical protein